MRWFLNAFGGTMGVVIAIGCVLCLCVGGCVLLCTGAPLLLVPAVKQANEASRATVIALDEPNISLKITLTGDAAKDAVGRKKIGAVTEHYASGSAVANVSETIGTGPVTSEVLRALDKGGAA